MIIIIIIINLISIEIIICVYMYVCMCGTNMINFLEGLFSLLHTQRAKWVDVSTIFKGNLELGWSFSQAGEVNLRQTCLVLCICDGMGGMGLPCAPRSGTTNLQETDNIFDMSILFK
jgi:hypothetical protein